MLKVIIFLYISDDQLKILNVYVPFVTSAKRGILRHKSNKRMLSVRSVGPKLQIIN